MAAWVDSVLARRVELWNDKLVLPPALAAVLASADERLVLLEWDAWHTPGGREFGVAASRGRAAWRAVATASARGRGSH
jgi:hypothetical protein